MNKNEITSLYIFIAVMTLFLFTIVTVFVSGISQLGQ